MELLWVLLVWAALSSMYPHPFSSSTQELCSSEPLTNREAHQDTCAWKGVLSVTAVSVSSFYPPGGLFFLQEIGSEPKRPLTLQPKHF